MSLWLRFLAHAVYSEVKSEGHNCYVAFSGWRCLTGKAVQPRYDTIRDAILTCDRKPTWVSLIYRTEPTTKKCENRKKTKSRKLIYSKITVNSPGNPRSKYLSRRKEGPRLEGFAEKEGFKPGKKEWVGDGIPNNSKYDCWQIKTKTV